MDLPMDLPVDLPMDLQMALVCSCPSYVEGMLAGLGKPMAFACRADAYAFAAMLKAVPRATAKESPFAFQAYSCAFAAAKAVLRRMVWPTAEQAYSFPACCPSDFGLQDSFASVLCSC